MRLKNLFGMAAMLALAASCGENALVQGGDTGASETGTSYAAFNIVLPTTNGTRADGAPTYEDGTTEEYKVNNGTILIFQKTGTEYTFIEKATLDNGSWTASSEAGITTYSKVTAQLKSVISSASSDYYAIVLLNNATAVSMPTSGKYSTWNNTAQTKTVKELIGEDKNNFLMTNAALNDADNPFGTLVKIDKRKIYNTEDAAKNGDAAATIHVQRAVAKVTAKVGTGTGISGNTVNVKGSTTDAVEFNKWVLDVTNKKTFPVQNITGLADAVWGYTYDGTNYTVGAQNRLFWAIDPNYNNGDLNLLIPPGPTERGNNFNIITSFPSTSNNMGDNDYCLENTFDLTNQKQGQTTRVVFKATYKVGGTAATFFKVGNNSEILNATTLTNKIQGVAQTIFNATDATGTITINLGAIATTASSNNQITVSNILVNGTALDEGTTYGSGTNAKTGTEIVKAVKDNLGLTTDAGISTYLDGINYYIVRIKHFGDTYTPWVSGNVAYGPDTNNNKWLGRYGVLRNNWYVLQINSVSGPGYPTIPPVKPNTPDDESEKYISCTIKILDWAKRTQDVNL